MSNATAARCKKNPAAATHGFFVQGQGWPWYPSVRGARLIPARHVEGAKEVEKRSVLTRARPVFEREGEKRSASCAIMASTE